MNYSELSKDLFDPSKDPFVNFLAQLKNAEQKGVPEPTAMSIATCGANGIPQNRMVLFKGLLREGTSNMGLSFYTNYNSPKSQELIQNPKLSACFFWAPLATQIRITGIVEKTTRAESEKYFDSRPEMSKVGAWASDQSKPIANYGEFEEKIKFFAEKFKSQKIPCPPHWGGWLLIPNEFEFWFGIEGRLHYRYAMTKKGTSWSVQMRSP